MRPSRCHGLEAGSVPELRTQDRFSKEGQRRSLGAGAQVISGEAGWGALLEPRPGFGMLPAVPRVGRGPTRGYWLKSLQDFGDGRAGGDRVSGSILRTRQGCQPALDQLSVHGGGNGFIQMNGELLLVELDGVHPLGPGLLEGFDQ